MPGRPGDQASAITGISSSRIVYRGERISNLVDYPRLVTSPAVAGTTALRPKRRLQACSAAISAAPCSRSSCPSPCIARCKAWSGSRLVVTTSAFEYQKPSRQVLRTLCRAAFTSRVSFEASVMPDECWQSCKAFAALSAFGDD